jgi:serine protease AprX
MTRLTAALAIVITLVFGNGVTSAQSLNGLATLGATRVNADGSLDGIATFGGSKPTASQLDSLRALGLRVQGFDFLPLAALRGTRAALIQAVTSGIAADVYPNLRLRLYSAASNTAMRANEVQALGVNGAGVAVAIVDSGIDATHPDLAQRVKHNMKIIEQPVGPLNEALTIAVDQGPYNDSDTSSGHGTHVAGIVAADNTDGQVLGVAPGADLIGYGCGDAVLILGVLTAYDDMIRHKDAWHIRVANNSWGSSFRLFDPDEPINQATKAAHDNGITVVFAAGNETTEMSLNPYSAAPWVISAGAATVSRQRASFSSGGIEFDDSLSGALPAGDEKHLAYSGDRIGLYHPSVSAPGVAIVSTGTTGVAVTSLPGGTASADGTSMASPHVAGVVALLVQKRPTLTPDEIKMALQTTSMLMRDTGNATVVQPFWQSGYGFVDAKAAVDLVGRSKYTASALVKMQQTRDKAVLGDRDYKVLQTDFWTFPAALATVNGTPDTKDYALTVGSSTKAIKLLVSYPSLSYVGVNVFDYHITLTDAAGVVVAESTASDSAGVSQLFVDISAGGLAYGTWNIHVSGDLGAQDQDTVMGSRVTLTAAQLAPQTRVRQTLPIFTPTGTASYYFTPGASGFGSSPEGCTIQASAPVGGLSSTASGGTCQTGLMGYAVNYGVGTPASFTGAATTTAQTVGGSMTMKLYLVDGLQPAWQAGFNPRVTLEVDAIDSNGEIVAAIGSGEWTICNTVSGATVCNSGPQPVGGVYTVSIPPTTIPAGARLSVTIFESAAVASTSRAVYGGRGLMTNYGDARVTLTTGTVR